MAGKPVRNVDASAAARDAARRAAWISNILSADTAGFSHKLAIAMADTKKPFVMGHGSGGKGFKGGNTGGYGRIHGLGTIDPGSGLGMPGKRVKRFGNAAEARRTCMEACLKKCEGK